MNRRLKGTALIAMAVGLLPVLTGCGGFSSSRSVSPASFLLPGLVRNGPASGPEAAPGTNAHQDSDIS